MKPHRSRQHGVSLIEALVAMAIMGFGMLGVMGMQTTLRGNGDIAKQRSEAVRIAQAQMEARRAFSVVGSVGAGAATSFVDITSGTVAATQLDANASFTRTDTVTSIPASADQDYLAPRKTLTVEVSWSDRNNAAQNVRIGSIITSSAPELAAALVTPGQGSMLQSPGGRHVAVPRGAVNIPGTGTSRFTPPNSAGTGVSWIFSNTTGYIRQTCINTTCVDFSGRLLSGYVRFALTTAAVTLAEASNPSGPAIAGLVVKVDTGCIGADRAGCFAASLPAPSAAALACFQDESNAAYVAYFCAVPINAVPTAWWSGKSFVTGLPLAADANDADPARYRICRYTPTLVNTPTPEVANEDHPAVYFQVSESLMDQNFLVIRAGYQPAGAAPPVKIDCPAFTELAGRTVAHQPPGP